VGDLNFETIKQPELNAVPQENPVDNAVTETATSTPIKATITYRQLPSAEQTPCNGQNKGDPCPLLAEYEFQSEDNPEKPRYCKRHLDESVKACTINGFQVLPAVTVSPIKKRDDSEDYPEPGEGL
jgi:hypothetical protein